MIHIIYGTRAELIKFSALIRQLNRQKINFKLVDTGDHDTKNLRNELNLPKPDFYFGKSPRDTWHKVAFPIAAFLALVWGAYVFIRLLFLFLVEGKIIVYHNNTKIIPLCVIASKILFFKNLKTVHYESGLRGNTKDSAVFDFYARIGDHGSKFLFAPTKSCEKNLRKEKVSGKIIFTGSAVDEIVKSVLKRNKMKAKSYVFINSSRSIFSRKNAEEFVRTLNYMPFDVITSLNPRMKFNLSKFGLFEKINSKKVKFVDNPKYSAVLQLISGAEAVVTDSQGVQEECAVLKVPCVVTNDFIQYPELVECETAKITGWDSGKILSNIKNLDSWKRKIRMPKFYDGKSTQRAVRVLTGMLQ